MLLLNEDKKEEKPLLYGFGAGEKPGGQQPMYLNGRKLRRSHLLIINKGNDQQYSKQVASQGHICITTGSRNRIIRLCCVDGRCMAKWKWLLWKRVALCFQVREIHDLYLFFSGSRY